MRTAALMVALAATLAAPAALAQKARVDRSATSRLLAALPQAAGDKPVVAIYEVRSAVPEIAPKAATEMFMTALVKSGAFRVAERARLNEGAGRERALLSSGATAVAGADGTLTVATPLPFAAARYVFGVVVSEANVGAGRSDNSFALGGAQLDRKASRDVIGIDIRITDVSTGLVLDAVNTETKVEARASQVSGLNSLAGKLIRKAGARGVPLGADARLSSSRQDGVDRALRMGMEVGVAELVRRLAPAR